MVNRKSRLAALPLDARQVSDLPTEPFLIDIRVFDPMLRVGDRKNPEVKLLGKSETFRAPDGGANEHD